MADKTKLTLAQAPQTLEEFIETVRALSRALTGRDGELSDEQLAEMYQRYIAKDKEPQKGKSAGS